MRINYDPLGAIIRVVTSSAYMYFLVSFPSVCHTIN